MPSQSLSQTRCAEKIRRAGRIAVLTGAGISTAAGVPDFRGPKGLYTTRAYDPETVFDIAYFDRDPLPFCQFSRDFLSILSNLKPTFTHRFFADLERDGAAVDIVTQNIDGLHQRAGSTRVFPMHGDYGTAHCRRCGRGYAGEEFASQLLERDIPACDACGGVIKPDVVFFGENVLHLDAARRACAESDLMFVLGSSLLVYPAAMLPEYAGGDIVIVNKGPTGARLASNVFPIDADLDDFFAGVADRL